MKRIFFPYLFISFFFFSCTSKTTISNIQNNPRDYVDKNVVVKGKVTEVLGLVVFSYFTIDDGTGTIRVITSRPLPKKGNELKVEGKVLYFAFGEESILVIEEKSESQEGQ